MCGIDAYVALSGLDISWTSNPRGVAPGYMDCAPLGLNDEANKNVALANKVIHNKEYPTR